MYSSVLLSLLTPSCLRVMSKSSVLSDRLSYSGTAFLNTFSNELFPPVYVPVSSLMKTNTSHFILEASMCNFPIMEVFFSFLATLTLPFCYVVDFCLPRCVIPGGRGN